MNGSQVIIYQKHVYLNETGKTNVFFSSPYDDN